MKYLDIERLNAITAFLTDLTVGGRQLRGRLEAYSCKAAGGDKKLSKQLEQQWVAEMQEDDTSGTSPLGNMADPAVRRLLVNLICTLNATFPDYEFSTLRPENFVHEPSLGMVMNSVNTSLKDVVEAHNEGFLEELWSAIDEVITCKDCQIYSFVPDVEGADPFAVRGSLWNLNFFFYNKQMGRCIFFTCCALSKLFQEGSRSPVGFDEMEDVNDAPHGALEEHEAFGGMDDEMDDEGDLEDRAYTVNSDEEEEDDIPNPDLTHGGF